MKLLPRTIGIASGFLVLLVMQTAFAQRPFRESADVAARSLSPAALDTLVSGIALYPDPVIEQILDATQHPAALRQAVGESPRLARRFAQQVEIPVPESVRFLSQYPELLQQLNEHLVLTARLGQAAKQQLQDVWDAIDRVRAQIEQQASEVAADGATETATETVAAGVAGVYAPYVTAAGVVARGYRTPLVVNELYGPYGAAAVTTTTTTASGAHGSGTQTTTTTTLPSGATVEQSTGSASATGPRGGTAETTGSSTTVTGPAGTTTVGAGSASTTYTGPAGGTATTSREGAGIKYQNGDTTAVAGVGQKTITGPEGNSATVSGGGTASVTQTANGATFNSAATGTVSTNTGVDAAGTRTGSGSVTNNADGSTTLNRNADTSLSGQNGSADISRSSTATANGDGTGSYSGQTSINSSKGSAEIATQAGNQQLSTTVTTDNGSKTYTAGDGQIQNAPQGNSRQSSSLQQSSSGDPSTQPVTESGARDRSPFSRQTAENSGAGQNRRTNGTSRYSAMNLQQIDAAHQALSHNWNQLNQQRGSMQTRRPAPSDGSSNGARPHPQTAPRSGFNRGQPARQGAGRGGFGGRGGRPGR